MVKGYLSLIFHAHLPFVRHPEHDDFLEEDWLYEAITETYIPLIKVFEGLVRDNIPYRITMSLTPTLISMLEDELLQARYINHIEKLIELAEKEIITVEILTVDTLTGLRKNIREFDDVNIKKISETDSN